MNEVVGDLWEHHPQNWVVITTNGFRKGSGEAVMGRGVALQAARRYPHLPLALGSRIKTEGNHVHTFPEWKLISFPVKHNWWEMADINLIKNSVEELLELANYGEIACVYMPRPGCGNGGLKWDRVKPLLAPLDHRFTIVEKYQV